MDLYKEILAHALTYGEVHVTFADQNPNISEIVGNKCYQALEKIKAPRLGCLFTDPAIPISLPGQSAHHCTAPNGIGHIRCPFPLSGRYWGIRP